MTEMPTGLTVLAHDGGGPAPMEKILNSAVPETDPERRGAQVLLAAARGLRPNAGLAELVAWVRMFSAKGAEPDAELVADVARAMGLS